MTVSVVIPALNESRYIDRCLEALENQTVAPFEIIVVDNNSTDDTVERANSHLNIRVISESRCGISMARNAGFDLAKGDIIARCDVDSIVDEHWVEEVERFLTKHRDVQGVTGPASFYDIGSLLRKPFDVVFLDGYHVITKIQTGGETLFGSNCAIRRSAWEKVRAEVCVDDANMHEDIDLGQHIARIGRIAYDPKLKTGISARPLWHPRKMVRRWVKGVNNYRRHREWRRVG